MRTSTQIIVAENQPINDISGCSSRSMRKKEYVRNDFIAKTGISTRNKMK